MKEKLIKHLRFISKIAVYGIFLHFILLSSVIAAPNESVSKSALQTGKISGQVTSEDSPEGLIGVNVVLKGSTIGTVTDIDGNFEIEVPSGETVLIFSSIGYNTEEIIVGDKNFINVEMIPDLQKLDEVIVVGYGTQSKRDITGAVQTVSMDDMAEVPGAQLTQKLQGRLAGVQINQFTGMPGAGMNIRIRGQFSISADSDPLYVIDGMPIVGNISQINPNEIESLTILKDAASTSLYGSRAANGVVLITTKGAKAGETKVSLNAYYGFQQVPQRGRPEMMNAREFAQFKKESYEEINDYLIEIGKEEDVKEIPAAFLDPSQYGEGTNMYDLLLQTAPIQDYSLSLSKGSENHSISAVVGYFNQEGVMLNSGYERFSLRANASMKIIDRIRTGINIAPTYSVRNQLDSDGLFYTDGGQIINNAMLAWPIVPYKNEDGTISPSHYIPDVSAFKSPNWYYTIQNTTDEVTTTNLLSNYFIEAEIIDGLVIKSTLGADLGYVKLFEFRPSTVSHAWTQPPPQNATGQLDNEFYYSWLNENTFTYNKSIGDHNITFLGGYTQQRYRMEKTEIDASIFTDDRTPAIESAENQDIKDDVQEWSLRSYITRLNYNYKGKYLLTAAIRGDGSSRFGVDNQWGNFPSVSAGWIVSDEAFFSNLETVSFLKLRASYGVTGNNSIGNYRHLATLSTTNSAVFGANVVGGVSPLGMGNPNLGWETTNQTDIGFDIGLFGGRIQILYDYYSKKTTNLLFEVDVPRASGFESMWDNVGEVKFWGNEFSVNTKNLTHEFKWNTNFNIAFSKNEVLELSGLTDRVYGDKQTPGGSGGSTITIVGEPIGQFYGLVQDGVYDNQAEFDNSPIHDVSQVGGIKFKDINGDGEITLGGDDDDRTILGNPFPKAVYGITNDFYYKNIDLSIVLSGAYGHSVARMSDIGATNLDGVFNVLKDVEGRWRSEEDPGDGKYGRVSGTTYPGRDWFSSRFVHKGDYLCIRNITLGYTIPMKVEFIESARLFTSINNAHIFTKYDGVNPEVGTRQDGEEASDINYGFDFGTYPVPRTVCFGFNLNF